MSRNLNSTSNTVDVLKLLIRQLKIPVTSFTIKDSLENHPGYPSLLSLSDCLTSWKVPNKAYEVDKDTIEELPTPFIAHLDIEPGQFVLVDQIKDGIIRFSNEKEINVKITTSDFCNRWDGVILYAQKTEASGEDNYVESVIKNSFYEARVPLLILILLGTALFTMDYSVVSWQYYGLFIIKLAGVFVSILLLLHSIDTNNPFVQNLCNFKNNNCNAILKSSAAKITSWLSWSEVGLFYFFGSLTYLFLVPSGLALLGLLNLLALPYTFYSIGYQLKTKKWCILCCSVQLLLWLETLAFFSEGYTFRFLNAELAIRPVVSFLLCFSFPVFLWYFLKPFFMDSSQLKPLKAQLNLFKYDKELFDQLLKNQRKYDINDDLKPLVFGNAAAQNVITMVSHPLCPACGEAHKKINEWMQSRDDLQLKVIFLTADHDDDRTTRIARHLSALSNLDDQGITERALMEWYTRKSNFEVWMKNFPAPTNEEVRVISKKQKAWSDLADITYTPTIFINGYKLPVVYTLDDIKYMLN